MTSAVDYFAECHGLGDVLIANVTHRQTSGLQFESEAAGDVITTNVVGVVNTLGAVLPLMVERNQDISWESRAWAR